MEQYANGQQQPSPAQVSQQHFQAAKMAQQSALGLGYPGSPGGSQTASPINAGAKPFPQPPTPAFAFMKALQEHLALKGTPLTGPLVVDGKVVDFWKLYQRPSFAQIVRAMLTRNLARQSSRALEDSPR